MRQIMEACELSESTDAQRIADLEREVADLRRYAADLERDLEKLETLKDIQKSIAQGPDEFNSMFGDKEHGTSPSTRRQIFNLLHHHMGQPVPMDRIISYVYGGRSDLDDPRRTIMVQMSRLRKELAPLGYEIAKSARSTYILRKVKEDA